MNALFFPNTFRHDSFERTQHWRGIEMTVPHSMRNFESPDDESLSRPIVAHATR
jgi:hypothetical protein